MPQTPTGRYAAMLAESTDDAINSIKAALGGVAGSENRINQIFALLNETEQLAPEDSETLLKDALKVVSSQKTGSASTLGSRKTSLSASKVSSPLASVTRAEPVETVVRIAHSTNGGKLFIRGSGAELSWEKGVEMMKEGENKWVYVDHSGQPLEFKFLVDDTKWLPKEGNYTIEAGQVLDL